MLEKEEVALCWNFGNEIAAAGLGLDISGAIFLSLGLMASPSSIASLMFSDISASRLPSYANKERYASSIPFEQAARSLLQGRVGLVCLVTGFMFQLIGLIIPSNPNRILLPLILALVTLLLSRYLGVKWIRKHTGPMVQGIFHAPVVQAIIDLKESRYQDPNLKWKETPVLRTIRRFYM